MKKRKLTFAADLFCGAGGTSAGMAMAAKELGMELDLIAINHWTVAIDTHTANHPWANHLCESLDTVDPRKIVPGGRLKLLVASPECTHHSNARGGKPMNDQSRASGWHVVRWAEALYIENILIENVREFRDWGPIGANGRPLKRQRGQTYQAFLSALRSLGYTVEERIINAANYGDPTTRERLFIMARRGGKKITWPDPSHTQKAEQTLFGQLPKWRPAREIIDWELKGESIFTRKKPLSPNTMKRIMAGLRKFGGKAFVIGQQSGATPRDVDQPVPTVAGVGAISLTQPFILNIRGGDDGYLRASSIEEPIPSLTTSPPTALVEPYLVMLNGTSEDALKYSNRSVNEPVPTVVGGGHIGLVEPFLVEYHGGPSSDKRTKSVEVPLPVQDTSNRFALVEPFLVGVGGSEGQRVERDINRPLPTLTATEHLALIEPFIMQMDFGGRNQSVEEPMNTITSADARAIVEPFIIPTNHGSDNRAHSIDEPMRTITSVDAWAIIEPYLIKYYGNAQGAQSVEEPAPTITGKDRIGIVIPELNGAVLDIRFRMLQPHELAGAMSFPKSYQFTGTREQKVKQIGNAVPVNTAKALCKSLLEN